MPQLRYISIATSLCIQAKYAETEVSLCMQCSTPPVQSSEFRRSNLQQEWKTYFFALELTMPSWDKAICRHDQR